MLNLDEMKSRIRGWDNRQGAIVFVEELHALIAEIERLRAELTTTLVACGRCGHGIPPVYSVLGLCAQCAASELTEKIDELTKLRNAIDLLPRDW